MGLRLLSAVAILAFAASLGAQDQRQAPPRRALPQVTQDFVSVDAPVVVLQHVCVIDGTGSAPADDQTVVIENGLIRSIGAGGSVPAGAKVMDLTGYTVIPGLVGMHEHMFYPGGLGEPRPAGMPEMYPEMAFSFPRLYLAAGVTTIRTAGSMEPYSDLEIKNYIDQGRIPGPRMHLTGPYLQGPGFYLPQLHTLTGPEDATRLVNYWADEGFTSFKAYQLITRAELGAAIKAAHARGLKVTGHLCSVTFPKLPTLVSITSNTGLGRTPSFTRTSSRICALRFQIPASARLNPRSMVPRSNTRFKI